MATCLTRKQYFTHVQISTGNKTNMEGLRYALYKINNQL